MHADIYTYLGKVPQYMVLFLYIKIKVLPSPGETVVLLERNELGGAVPGTTVLNGKAVGQLLKVSAGRGGGWWLQNGT